MLQKFIRFTELDIETFDTLQKDQLNLCHDVVVRYGGFISGTITDNTIVYFGYPEINDNDARIAGRAALELMNLTELLIYFTRPKPMKY